MVLTAAPNIPIPKLPGYIVPQVFTGEQNFKKLQTLTYFRGYAIDQPLRHVHERSAPAITSASVQLSNTDADDRNSPASSSEVSLPKLTATPGQRISTAQAPGSQVPKWIEYDKKVLRFMGYIREALPQNPMEAYQIRKMVLRYYLEDDTIEVSEPRQNNSGIIQGPFIKRHKALGPGGRPLSIAELQVQDTVTLYNRTLTLVDADAFTREYVSANLGATLAPAVEYPAEPIAAYRAAHPTSGGPAAKHGGPGGAETAPGKTLQSFLENSRKVLRFYCVWDDRAAVSGDRRPYRLHYFLEDDSVEVLEVGQANSGRAPFPVFLRRARLPKEFSTHRTALGLDTKSYYAAADLRIGAVITVYSRAFLLHDCDAFTRGWYRDNMGASEEELSAIDISEPMPAIAPPALPAYNGYGSQEDSAANCTSLLPQAPRKDIYKLVQKHRIVLRFACRFVATGAHQLTTADRARKFVLSYHLGDDTLSIFEPPQRNSGIAGGKFLERMSVSKPDSQECFSEQDLYVGAVLTIHRRAFELTEADEFTLTFMQNNRHSFIVADVAAALRAVAAQTDGREEELKAALFQADTAGTGLALEAFESGLQASGVQLVRHQAIAIYRHLPKNENGCASMQDIWPCLWGMPHGDDQHHDTGMHPPAEAVS